MSWPDPPEGFERRDGAGSALYVPPGEAAEALALELDRGAAWERALEGGDARSGRGASAVVGGWRIKRLRRGGLARPLWSDRYPHAGRLVAMLAASGEAIRRGIPTPRAVALLLEREGLLLRGFLATEEIDGAEDLARRAQRGAVTPADLERAARAVRHMHDRGLDHPDLNLANLLLSAHVHVIDLDRVSFHDGPVPIGRRRRALRRLERSCAKLTGEPGLFGPGSEETWFEAYAGNDAGLARTLSEGRSWRRLSLAAHRLRWKGGTR